MSNKRRSFCVNCAGLVVVRRSCVAMVSRFFSSAASTRFVPEEVVDVDETGLARPGPLIGDDRPGSD